MAAAELTGLIRGQTAHTQQILSYSVSRLRAVALRMVMKQLREPEQRFGGHRCRQFGISDVEPADPIGRGARPLSDMRRPKPTLSRQPEAASECFGPILHPRQLVEQRAERIEDFVQRGSEQLFSAFADPELMRCQY